MSEVIAQAAQSAVQNAIQNQGGASAAQANPSGATQAPSGTAAEGADADKGQAAAPKEDYAERIAQMARRERRIQEENRTLTAKYKELADKWERFDKEPEAVMAERGWNAEKYLERLATGKTPDPTVEDRVSSLQKEIETLRKAREDDENRLKEQTNQQAVANYQKSLNTVVDQDPDRYEAIRSLEMQDLVWTTAQEVFSRTKKIPDPKAVADAVEKDLRSKLDKGFSMKAFADRLKPTGQSATETKPPENYGGTTLTAQTTATTQPPSNRRETDDERMARAMATLKFK